MHGACGGQRCGIPPGWLWIIHCGCWELNSDHMEEQCILLATEPSLQRPLPALFLVTSTYRTHPKACRTQKGESILLMRLIFASRELCMPRLFNGHLLLCRMPLLGGWGPRTILLQSRQEMVTEGHLWMWSVHPKQGSSLIPRVSHDDNKRRET